MSEIPIGLASQTMHLLSCGQEAYIRRPPLSRFAWWSWPQDSGFLEALPALAQREPPCNLKTGTLGYTAEPPAIRSPPCCATP